MATTANVVKLKRSAVAGRVPATADLALGELALNTYDGRIYLKKSVASVESIVTLQSFPSGGTNGQLLQTDSSGNLSWVTSGAASAVSYLSQTITTEQQAQARLNISAISQEDAFVAAIIMG
jgi:hypothetical protein